MFISFNGQHEVRVRVSKIMGGEIEGICGNCNDIQDDFVTKDGTDVAGSAKEIRDAAIGASWAAYDPASVAEQ